MRPINLKMQAFGPYAGTEVIDFTKLGQEQIFVISGKTGSGKTTIFDAISFALYGKANTDARDGRSLRSDFAAEGTATEVDFTFTLKNRMYRIVRTPMQQIAKKNGEGFREAPATAHLYEIVDGEEHLVAQNPSEVDKQIQEKMQLTDEQFRQILMLPQGEFRKLLVASSKEKQTILQKLANTHFYREVEEALKVRQQELWQGIESLQSEKNQYVQRIFPEASLDISAQETKELFETKKAEFVKRIRDNQSEMSVLERKIENSQKDYSTIELLVREWDELDELAQELIQLNEEADEIVELDARVKKAKTASSLHHFEKMHQSAIEQKKEATELVQTTSKELDDIKIDYEQTEKDLQTHENGLVEQKERQTQYIRISDWEQKIKNLAADYELLEQYNKELDALTNDVETKQAQYAKVTESKEKFLTDEENIRQAKLQEKENQTILLKEEQELKEFKAEQVYLQEKEEINEKLGNFEAEIHVIAEKEEAVRQNIDEMVKNQNTYHAHQLAQHLEEGQPCLVCGSTEHPQIAFVEGAEIETEALESERVLLRDIETEKNNKKLEAERLLGKLEQIPKNIRNLESVTNEINRIETILEKTNEQQQNLLSIIAQESAVMDNLAWINLELNGLEKELQFVTEQVMDKRASVQQVQVRIDMSTREVPTQYRELDTYYKELAELKRASEAYEEKHLVLQQKLNQYRERVQQIETSFNSAVIMEKNAIAYIEKNEHALDQAIADAGFKTREAYEQIKMEPELIEENEQKVRGFEQKVYHKTQKHEELQRRLAGKEKPDLQAYADKLKQYQTEQQEKIKEITLLEENNRQVAEVEAEYSYSLEELAKAELVYREVGELADTANGKNQRNLGFERYVLGAFLDTILTHANTRLRKMTNGRFLLERKDTKAKHNAQSGLDLVIFDEYTGSRRDVTTLSGGESFKASLALALALAEVVQEQSGGISLDTMFIDEGFGTLDPESLDLAVEVLLENQSQDRLIGIISHVPELNARVEAVLKVEMTNHGSKTGIYLAGRKQ